MNRKWIGWSLGVLLALCSGLASAHNTVRFGVYVGGPVYPAPLYSYTPAPVYYGPPAVYYAPPRVYYAPRPYYYGPRHYDYGRHHGWRHHRR